jgi:hypothetical protein
VAYCYCCMRKIVNVDYAPAILHTAGPIPCTAVAVHRLGLTLREHIDK